MIDSALERFVELMDSVGISEAVAFSAGLAVLVYLLIVVHELGHAAVVLARTRGLVIVCVGRIPGAIRGRVGRLAFSFDVRPRDVPDDAFTLVVADLSRGEQIAYALAGPAANAALAIALAPLAWSLDGLPRYVTLATLLASVYLTVRNLVSRDPTSDGRIALRAIRGPSRGRDDKTSLTGETTDALGRWMALYHNARDPRFSNQRAFLFGIAPSELGVDPQTSYEEGLRCWNAARAGWCWREVRPVPADVVADLATPAWRNQSLEGLHGLELAAAAATEVARNSQGLADDPDVQAAFIATTGLREARAVPDDDSRFAFQFGVALHDVERVMAEQGQRYW